jgi:hypothetical protein
MHREFWWGFLLENGQLDVRKRVGRITLRLVIRMERMKRERKRERKWFRPMSDE